MKHILHKFYNLDFEIKVLYLIITIALYIVYNIGKKISIISDSITNLDTNLNYNFNDINKNLSKIHSKSKNEKSVYTGTRELRSGKIV